MATKRSTEQLTEAEIAHEQRHVDRVYARLDVLTSRANDLAVEGHGRASTMRDLGGVREEHSTALFERDVLVNHAVQRAAFLDSQHEGLVFGRLDRVPDADSAPGELEVHYIGRIGVRDEDQEPLVLDWRAPAASVFYQATAVEPLGVIRRRVLRCRGDRVTGIEDDLLDHDNAPADLPVIGEGALIAALSSARGRAMRDIVATIQREQDEIIRAPARGATLIGGGPGAGKTVVALHRAAYLLYADRRRMESGGVLVIGPSGVFMDYIERVLPSLGETSATLRSIGAVVDGMAAERHDPPAAAAVKGSARMRRVLARAARDAVPGAPEELQVFIAGRSLRLDSANLARIRSAVLRRGIRRNRAFGEAIRSVAAALWEQLDESTREQVPADDFIADVYEHSAVRAFGDKWWPALSAEEVLGWLAEPDRLQRYGAGVLSTAEIAALAESWQDPESARSVEDVALLDELIAILGRPPDDAPEQLPGDDLDDTGQAVATSDDEVAELTTVADRDYAVRTVVEPEQYDGYAHVLVDEAQDLSPMQWRMLGRRGRQATWTIVGDPAQSSWPDPAESAKAMDEALGSKTRREYRLSTNYRNSAEIFELAARVIHRELPGLEVPRAVRQTDTYPSHRLASPEEWPAVTIEAVEELLGAVEGTVGVLVAADRLASARAWLAHVDADRVSVATGIDAKGLEYDAVVLVGPREIVTESPVGARTLYVALTRATQRLVIVAEQDDGTIDRQPLIGTDA